MQLIDKNRVCVMMSTYNGEKYIDEQIKSILEQKDVLVSLYIRDDGSHDSTVKHIEEWSNKLYITLFLGDNVGTAKSFMELLTKVKIHENEYYAFADQDDYWYQWKIDRAISKLSDYREIPALYYSNMKFVGSELEEIENPFHVQYHTEEYRSSLIVADAAGCTMVFNDKLLELAQKYIPKFIYMHDEWILQLCEAVGGVIVYDPDITMLYRQHSNNVVSTLGKRDFNFISLFFYRMQKFFDYKYQPSLVAVELKNGFDSVLTDDNRRIIDALISSKKSLRKRMQILFSKTIKTPYLLYNIRFVFQVLLNRH